MSKVVLRDINHALAGMAYPARYWQVLAWADYNCANSNIRNALWRLPVKTYRNLAEIIAAFQRQPENV